MAEIRFGQCGAEGVVPAVVQDARDGTVIMLVEMNREALAATLETGLPHAWSRSQQCLYKPGEQEGEAFEIVSIKHDASGETLLLQVTRALGQDQGAVRTHFSRSLTGPVLTTAGDEAALPTVTEMPAALYDLIQRRREAGDEGSYVHGLFRRGQDVICKKVAEEAAEVVIASKNQAPAEIVYEMADLWFHATVLLGYHAIHPHDVWRELQRRFGQPGGGKAILGASSSSLPKTTAE